MAVTTYLVQPGDTWAGLAERFGVSAETLAAANHLPRPAPLVPGRPLVVPDLPLDLALGTFPGDGWVPREDEYLSGEAPRAVVVERMWHVALPFPALTVGFVDHLLLALHASPAFPRPGETVTLRLLVMNAGATPLILRYPTAQRAEFVVECRGREVFRASAGRLYAQQIREVVLSPGQAEVAVERFLPEIPCDYRVTAWNLALSPARLTLTLPVR